MRVLLLTDNYPPETNAAALRSHAHARRWVERGHAVTIITSFPNFPEGKIFAGYRQSLFRRELVEGVDVIRVPTLVSPNAGTIVRILDFASYMISASLASVFVRRPDVVVATSPQFFTALAGWLASFLKWRPFIFELRDLWPDSIVAVGALKDGTLIELIRRLEYFLYQRAKLIVSVTEAFRTHLMERGIDGSKITVIRNGTDLSVFSPGEAPKLRKRLGLEERVVVSYIGTIGMAHGLDVLLDVAASLIKTDPRVAFLIVGSGAEQDGLRVAAQARNLTNMVFVERVSHAEIVDYWRASDITLVLLRNDPLFRTVIPSKVFEAMATGTPIITNVKGELESLLEPLGAATFVDTADGAAELVEAIRALVSNARTRNELAKAGPLAAQRFDRNAQADLMLETLEQLFPTYSTVS